MKQPNGMGGIVDLGKKRRNRYAVRITDIARSAIPDADGIYRQKYRYLGYYPTRKDAVMALAHYNATGIPTPEEQTGSITFAEIWRVWSERNLTDWGSSRYNSYTSAYKKCAALYNKKITDIKLHHLQAVIDENAGASKSTLNNIKIVMRFIFTYAYENDYIQKNYVDYVKTDVGKDVQSHIPFTSADVRRMWKQPDIFKLPLMYIYTGCRPSELLEVTKDNVDLTAQCFKIEKSKTKAGIRTVPIADVVLPFFRQYYNGDGDLLIGKTYSRYQCDFKAICSPHNPHDTRSTCVSLLTSAGVPETIIQKIVGHKGGNVTRDVYTRLELPPMLEAVNKIHQIVCI